MSEATPKPPSEGLWGAIITALPADVRGILSVLLVIIAFASFPSLIAGIPAYFRSLASQPSVKEQCWELDERQSTIFKFNKCTGEVDQVDVKRAAPTKSPK